MVRMKPTHLVAAVALLLAGCAPTAESSSQNAAPTGRDCFNVRFLTGYESVDRDTIRVHAGVSDEYDVDLQGGQCDTVDWAQRLAIESTPSSWMCVGDQPGQGEIRFRDPTTRRVIQCYVTEIRRAPPRDSGPS